MKFIDEYRNDLLAGKIAARIEKEAVREEYRLMDFCGGHTHVIARYGIEDLLPVNIRMIHGPGCPVCVLPVDRIDWAIAIAKIPGVILCTYADLMRVPASRQQNLLQARSEGADIRMVYSTLDAVEIAKSKPDRQVVFMAIGFETTTPATAIAVKMARQAGLQNFSIFCNHVLTPPAIGAILGDASVRLDGFLGPSHVSVIIGTKSYETFVRRYKRPVVVTGFEPLDVLQAILMLVCQINQKRHEVENQYIRAVTLSGNVKAQSEIADVFELRDSFAWRGFGEIPHSALKLRRDFYEFDAEMRFSLSISSLPDNPACECGAILRGRKHPVDCRLFGTACTPEMPVGSCMVSSEGACAAHWSYGRFRKMRHQS